MNKVLIEPSFFQGAATLTGNETKRVLEFVNTFQKDPSHPSISLERLIKNNNVWSGRISQDLRAIIYKDGDSWILLYAGHHDDAYTWSERRNISRHNITGNLQITVLVETVEKEIKKSNTINDLERIFYKHKDDYLLSLGVPENWLPVIREIINEDELFNIVEKLPSDVAESLIRLAAGELVTPPEPISVNIPLIDSPEAIRRFYILEDDNELKRILEAPLEKWITFLHPSQKKLAFGSFKGPVKVTGSAGTGKTVVGMHRANFLAKQGKNVLFTSYVTTLCENIRNNLRLLCSKKESEKITVTTVHSQALNILKSLGIKVNPAPSFKIKSLLEKNFKYGLPLDLQSLISEWEYIIQAKGITSWPEYRDVNRSGRGKALSVKDRKAIWDVFDKVLNYLNSNSMYDWSTISRMAADALLQGLIKSPFDSVIVDEVQDLGNQELRFLNALAGNSSDSLMLLGDGGQRIYSKAFSLKSLGIDIRGRSKTLKINYRTTEQIRKLADKMLGQSTDDLDEGIEDRSKTHSLLKGPEPILKGFISSREQYSFVNEKIKELLKQGLKPEEIAIFSRTKDGLDLIEKELANFKLSCRMLSEDNILGLKSGVNLGTMHRAKGLEFKTVFVIDSSDNFLPLGSALKGITDNIDREDIIQKEKNLFYVSLTRARDELFVTWTGEPTRFMQDILTTSNN